MDDNLTGNGNSGAVQDESSFSGYSSSVDEEIRRKEQLARLVKKKEEAKVAAENDNNMTWMGDKVDSNRPWAGDR